MAGNVPTGTGQNKKEHIMYHEEGYDYDNKRI